MTPQSTAHAASPSQRATQGTRTGPHGNPQGNMNSSPEHGTRKVPLNGTPKGPPTAALAWATDSPQHDLQEGESHHSSFGLPADRQARMAARRAFVALKLSFLYVVDGLEGKTELQARVRVAEEPDELWALRAPVFAALNGDDAQNRSRRQLLNRSLETMFPTATPQMN